MPHSAFHSIMPFSSDTSSMTSLRKQSTLALRSERRLHTPKPTGEGHLSILHTVEVPDASRPLFSYTLHHARYGQAENTPHHCALARHTQLIRMSFLPGSITPALLCSCHRKVISHSDGHSILRMYYRCGSIWTNKKSRLHRASEIGGSIALASK